MKKLYWMSVIFFGFLAPSVFARVKKPSLRGGAMLSCSGLPCVDITLKNDKHVRMLIDMGDSYSIIDTAMAKSMGLQMQSVTGEDGKPAKYGKATLEGARNWVIRRLATFRCT